jgi:hypothetical protein
MSLSRRFHGNEIQKGSTKHNVIFRAERREGDKYTKRVKEKQCRGEGTT